MSDLAHDRIEQLCDDLKLPGILDAYNALAAVAAEKEQSFTDFLENALCAERDFRRARSAATLIRMAGFPALKTLEDYDFKFASAAPKRQIEQLASLAFVARKENALAIVLGPMADKARSLGRLGSAKRILPLRSVTRQQALGSKLSSSRPLI